MTYRERREQRAERLREWADGREARAAAERAKSDAVASMIPMGQPILVGHHSEKRHRRDIARIENGLRSSIDNGRKADEMRGRADEIERQADGAIYSDDPDAVERLREKLEGLEAKREQMKARNAEFRKANREALKGMTAYERSQVVPFPSYAVSNLGGVITTTRKRIADIESGAAERRASADRTITAKYGGSCAECGAAIERGALIRYSRAEGARCAPECSGQEER